MHERSIKSINKKLDTELCMIACLQLNGYKLKFKNVNVKLQHEKLKVKGIMQNMYSSYSS